jgi:hypothetical protein
MFIPQARFDPAGPKPISVPYTNTGASDIFAGTVLVANGKVQVFIDSIRALNSKDGQNTGSLAIGHGWYDFLCDAAAFAATAFTAVYWNATGSPVDTAGSVITALAGTGCLTTTAGSNFVGFVMGETVSPVIPGDGARVRAWLTESVAQFSSTIYGDVTPGGIVQGTRAQSLTQNYPLGTKMVTADGRVFRYCKARTALHTEFGACYAAKTITNAVAPTQASGAGTVGSSTVTMTVAATDGIAGDGVVALNELAGGYVVIGNGTSQHPQNRMIVGNTAVANGGGVCTLTLDEALDHVVTVGITNIETLMNPFILSDGNVTNNAFATFLGMPACEMTINYYGWVQTKGICWITSDGATGAVAHDHRCYFEVNGSVKSASTGTAPTLSQLAGYSVDLSSNGASNAPFVNLALEV